MDKAAEHNRIPEHTHADGTVHDEHGNHVHLYEHTHCHGEEGVPHVHGNKKAVLSRLARANGHLESIIRMVECDRDCAEVLVQLAAVRSAINNAGKVILQDHIAECVTEAVMHNDQRKIDELNAAIAQFIK